MTTLRDEVYNTVYSTVEDGVELDKATHAIAQETNMARPIAERIRECEQRSARALITANKFHEKGDDEKAEIYYYRSSQWLMRANDLIEYGRIRKTDQA